MATDDTESNYREWIHGPSHKFEPHAVYFLTAGTYRKVRLFDTAGKRDFLLDSLFHEAQHWDWDLQAWAVMSNHYHFVATAPANPKTLRRMITALHSKTAIWINQVDDMPSRHVWFQYRDTCLTYQRSYLARLNYVHNNPVKHGLVRNAEDYTWCSMAWFQRNAEEGFRRTVLSMKHDKVNVEDDF